MIFSWNAGAGTRPPGTTTLFQCVAVLHVCLHSDAEMAKNVWFPWEFQITTQKDGKSVNLYGKPSFSALVDVRNT